MFRRVKKKRYTNLDISNCRYVVVVDEAKTPPQPHFSLVREGTSSN